MQVRVIVSESLRQRVRVRCAELGVSLGQAVVEALEMWLGKK